MFAPKESSAKPKHPPQCADTTCVQFLEEAEPAPFTGVLLQPRDAAELVVSASVSRNLFELELNRREREQQILLSSARQLCQAEQDTQEKIIDAYRRDAERREEWHRAPLLWFVAGVVVTSLTLLAGQLVFP